MQKRKRDQGQSDSERRKGLEEIGGGQRRKQFAVALEAWCDYDTSSTKKRISKLASRDINILERYVA